MKAFDISNYLETSIGGLKRVAGRSGDERTAPCPSCEKAGKWYVNAETGRFVCFSCGFSGRSIAALVAHLEGLTYSEACSYVFRNSIELRRKFDTETLVERISSLRNKCVIIGPSVPPDLGFPKGVVLCYDESREPKWQLPAYLKDRGIKAQTAREWNLGFCRRLAVPWPGREEPLIIRDRLFIPISCPGGKSWTARDMTGKQDPKYLNPPDASQRLLLIGWDQTRLTGDLCIVEGPTDALRMHRHGIPAVALGGKVLHDEQLAMLVDLPKETNVIVLLDPEEEEAPLNVAARLSLHFNNIYIAKLPPGVDPGASSQKQAMEAVDLAEKWNGGRGARLAAVLAKSKALVNRRYGIV